MGTLAVLGRKENGARVRQVSPRRVFDYVLVNFLRIRNEGSFLSGKYSRPGLCGFYARKPRGVTTTEYVLILGIIAVALYGSYRALGNNIGSLANGVDSTLTVASHGVSVAQSTPKPESPQDER